MSFPPPVRSRGTYGAGVADVVLWAPVAVVRVWYPIPRNARGPRARYRFGESGVPLRSRILHALIRSRARAGAAGAAGLFPLVLYVPSWGGRRSENSMLAQTLASRGFVVAALDDNDPETPLDFSSPEAIAQTRRRADAKAARLARHLSSVLTALSGGADAQRSEPFMPLIDARRVGALGYSFGGAVAAEAALNDARIIAAANLDGWMFGDAARLGVAKPFMVIGTGEADLDPRAPRGRPSGPPESYAARFDADNEARMIAGLERCGGFFLAVDGSRHLSFCDAAVLSLPRRRRAAGPIGARRAQRIVMTYLGAFLERYVAGGAVPLFDTAPGNRAAPPVLFDPAVRPKVWRPPPGFSG